MTLLDIALKNILRDWRIYMLHFLNCLLCVVVFFLFCALTLHPGMEHVSAASTIGLLTTLAAGIIAAFAIGFVSYSQGCFLTFRSKQFGLMTLIGMSKRQRRHLVIAEGGIVAVAALAGGIAIGLVLLKLFLTIAGLVIGSDFGFYLPAKALALTVAAFVPIFAIASLLGLRFIARKSIADLLSSEEKDEKMPRLATSAVLAILFAGMAALAYPIAENETGVAANLVVAFAGAAGLVCASLFIMQGILGARKLLSKKTGSYYRGTRMLEVSLFDSSARSNLQSMTLSAVLYTAAFLSVAVLVAISGGALQTAQNATPYSLLYTVWNNPVPEQEHIEHIREALADEPGLAEADFGIRWIDKDERIAVMPESEYNQAASLLEEPAAHLESGKVLHVTEEEYASEYALPKKIEEAASEQGLTLTVARTSHESIATEGMVSNLYVLSDADFDACFANVPAQYVYAFNYDDWTEKSIAEHLPEIEPFREQGDVALVEANRYYVSEKTQFGTMLYLACFVSIVFILAIASFSYSRLHARAEREGRRFAAIAKLGLSRKELTRLCAAHAATLLLLPFALSIVYFWIGATVIQSSLDQSLFTISVAGTAIACTVEIVVWMLVSRSYAKNVVERAFA